MLQLIFAILIMALLASCVGCGGGDQTHHVDEPNKPYDSNVHFVAKTIVADGLKSPSTAEFPYKSDIQITDRGNGVWTVLGYVDSQNSFGAMIRTNYKVEMTAKDTCDDYNLRRCWDNVTPYY